MIKRSPFPFSLLLILLILVLALTLPAGATVNDYYVNCTSGLDTNSGSSGSPWKTIGHADAALVIGSTGTNVHVTGTCTGPITTNRSGSAPARIVFISDTRWAAHIVTANWLVRGSYVDINGFDMTSPGSNGFCVGTNGVASGTAASFVHILYNYCHDVSTSSCPFVGAIFDDGTQSPPIQSTDNWAIGNVVRHGGTPGCTVIHGIYMDGPRDIIQDNIVSGFGGWCIQRVANGPGSPFIGVISGNTLFNCGGGLVITEQNNAGFQATYDYNTVSNNIIVNNGGSGSQQGYGISYFHMTGTHNLVTNNMVYGNLPANYGNHGSACTGGTAGCPASNQKADAGVSTTFVSFQSDFNASPAASYDAANYKLKPGSNAIAGGSTSCASAPGISPCTPTTDFGKIPVNSPMDLGIWAFNGSGGTIPPAPTGLTAIVASLVISLLVSGFWRMIA